MPQYKRHFPEANFYLFFSFSYIFAHSLKKPPCKQALGAQIGLKCDHLIFLLMTSSAFIFLSFHRSYVCA